MPQTPPPRVGANAEAIVSPGGLSTMLNISAPTVVRAQRVRLCRVNVTTAGSSPGSINDAASTGAVAAANVVMTIPNAVGAIAADWPCASGIVVTPGSGQTVSVSFL